ncbi:MAG: RNA polymerase sigma factor [Pseudomonadota bacterium]|nr:RNA polymerase sigma factor [Pseudomonadota bacterium]
MPGEQVDLLTDRALLARCGSGDRDACGAFLARHLDAAFRYARALTGDPVLAEDAVQDAFVAAMRGASGFAGGESARGWILTITRNSCHRQHRRRVGQPARFEGLDELGVAAGWGADPEEIMVAREDRAAFTRALGSLGPDDQEILVLRDLEGLSGDDAAAMLGVPLATMKTRLHRARLRLAGALREGGLGVT